MKKKVTKKAVKKTAPKKTSRSRRITRSSSSSLSIQPVIFHRITIITACLVLFIGGVIVVNRNSVNQTVAGVSIARGLFLQTTVQMPTMSDAASYNIYYKESGDKEFTNAVRNISPDLTTYTISYLKRGTKYQYMIAAVDKNGKEFFFTAAQPLPELQPM